MPEDKKQHKKAQPPDPLEGRTFPSGWESARWVFLRRKLAWRAWHILLAVYCGMCVFVLVLIRMASDLTGWRSAAEVALRAFAAILLLVALYIAARRLDVLRFIWGGKESWRHLYRWDGEEERFVRLRPPLRFESVAGALMALNFVTISIALATGSRPILQGVEFYDPPYYAEFVSVMREGPSDEWRACVAWRELDHDFKGSYLALGVGGLKDDGRDHYSFHSFPDTDMRRSNVRRVGPDIYHSFASLRRAIEEFCKDRPEPSSRDKGSVAYRFVFRDLERGRFTAENLSADELRRAGVDMEWVDRMLDEPLQDHP